MVVNLTRRFLVVILLGAWISLSLAGQDGQALTERERRSYGILLSAVAESRNQVLGVFGDKIPPTFDRVQFLNLMKEKLSGSYYRALKDRHFLYLIVKDGYYLLTIAQGYRIILYDFSCTPEVDGRIILEPPGRFDLSRMERDDPCREMKLKSAPQHKL